MNDFRIFNVLARVTLSRNIAAVTVTDRIAIFIVIFHAIDFAIAVQVVLGRIRGFLSALVVVFGSDHAFALTPFVVAAGHCAGFAGTDIFCSGWTVIAGLRLAIGTFAFCCRAFTAVRGITVAVHIIAGAACTLSILAADVIRTGLAAAAAIVRVVHQIVAKIVITEGFTRAFNAFPIDADSRISTALAACSAMSLVILNIGTIAPAWLLAFFA